MNEEKMYEMLLNIMQKLAVVEAKLDTIEEIKIDAKAINNRVDHLEAECREYGKSIKSLEHRADTMEQFTRNNMADSKRQMTSVYISIGMAVFSAVLSFIFGFLK